MDIDLAGSLGAVARSVTSLEKNGAQVRKVTLERIYNTSQADLWDALTSPERLPRWFLPVAGELRPGGRYRLEGNAEGTITRCEPPEALDLTWEFGGEISWVEVGLEADGEQRCRLVLSHICPVDAHWEKYGPGAAGVGWDLGLLGLAWHVELGRLDRMDEETFVSSDAGREFIAGCSTDWGRAATDAGEDEASAGAAAQRTRAFYLGEPEPEA